MKNHTSFFGLVALFSLLFAFQTLSYAESPNLYAGLLQKIATENGVHWNRFGPDEKKLLEKYMTELAVANPASLPTVQDQLAFWINAHNACVMKLISDHLPLPSDDVMKIEGFRDRLTCEIAGAKRSLTDIESGVIRPLFTNPKVHFALWWGTRGGPRLLATPYEGKTIEKRLEEQTDRFVQNDQFVHFDKSARKFSLSPLFDWYKFDFGPRDSGVIVFLQRKLPKEKATKLPNRLSDVRFTTFDWSLDQVTD